ncbi:MAG: cell surface protein [bacterium]|nr:cell surface protein [bacterium]
MKYHFHWLCLLLLIGLLGCSKDDSENPVVPETADPWPDEVISFRPGSGAGFGQSNYPGNVLGAPDTSASWYSPSNRETEILAMGNGGELVLAFRDGGIENGEGVDFTIFENVFENRISHELYQECAFVSVSDNGNDWFTFPYDTITFVGLAGRTPTNGNINPTMFPEAGGDGFDLATVGLQHATFVKLTDCGSSIPDDGDSFDLDAIVVLNGEGK